MLGMLSGLKGYLYGAIALVVVTIVFMGVRWFIGVQAEIGNLREANAEYTIQVGALETEKKSNEIVIDSLRTAMKTQAEAINIVNDQFSDIRDIREKEQRVLEGSRLGRLAAEKAGLIESKSNAATKERFTEFQGVINEDF
jgi:hypothetical protein